MNRGLCLLVVAGLISACGGVAQEEHDRVQSELKSLRNDLTVTQRKLADTEKQVGDERARAQIVNDRFQFLVQKTKGVRARIKTNHGNIEVEFYPEQAPLHCFNFITRAESGFYDGTLFHRVIPGFMIQGGDPLSKDDNPANDGSGGPIISIPWEINELKHTPGILSMASVGDPRAGAGSQFFIMHKAYPSLNGKYTVFGKATNGMEVVDKIVNLPRDSKDRPETDARILSIDVYR